MQFSTAFIVAALPFLTAATQPLKLRQSGQSPVYTMTAISSGDEAVHNQQVVAANENFYLYRNSSSLCGSDSPTSCAKPTQISLDNLEAALSVSVPGGQSIFVTSTGALSYTPPHSHSTPDGARSTGFSGITTGDNSPAAVSNLMFSEAPAPIWYACPAEAGHESSYQIFANVTGFLYEASAVEGCHAVAIGLVAGDAADSPFEFA